MAKKNKAKQMVMKPCFRMKVVDDKKKKSHNRKLKHKNRDRYRGFYLCTYEFIECPACLGHIRICGW